MRDVLKQIKMEFGRKKIVRDNKHFIYILQKSKPTIIKRWVQLYAQLKAPQMMELIDNF